MRIQLASDLHLEHLARSWPLKTLVEPVADIDVLVLAGDIANLKAGESLANFKDWPAKHKILVAGNHEHYQSLLGQSFKALRESCRVNGFTLLENERIVIDGVQFLGATLWTDYALYAPELSVAHAMAAAERGLNDHRVIRTGRHLLSAQACLDMHTVSRRWLAQELSRAFNGKTVVVSHHGPHPLSVDKKYQGDRLTPAFVSDCSALLDSADLWLHGHVHDGCDYRVGRCRVVANPAGYIFNRSEQPSHWRFENPRWSPSLSILV